MGAGRGFAEFRRLEPIFLRFWKGLSDLNRPNPPSPVFCFIDTEGGDVMIATLWQFCHSMGRVARW